MQNNYPSTLERLIYILCFSSNSSSEEFDDNLLLQTKVDLLHPQTIPLWKNSLISQKEWLKLIKILEYIEKNKISPFRPEIFFE